MYRTCFLISTVAWVWLSTTEAFAPNSRLQGFGVVSNGHHDGSSSSSSALHVLPPMIIGPMIKKMREKDAEKRMPMADPNEAKAEAPGLRVGTGAWKWPAVWPYEESFFMPSGQADALAQKRNMDSMQSLLSGGMPSVPDVDEATKEADESKFKSLEYWEQQSKNNADFELDPDAAAKLTQHYEFYLRDGMSILELGAGKNSYLGSIKPSRHVGVAATLSEMEDNPSLTERMVVDLNNVVPERDIDSDELRKLATEPFDAIIMNNVIAFLTGPREVYRSAWYLLKPGGSMFVSFPSASATKDIYTDAQTNIWRQYNDDQHMWIAGSFFEFSAGDGWQNLKGFDISPDSAKDMDVGGNPLMKAFKQGKDNNMFVVQATKAAQQDSISEEDPEQSIKSLTWMLTVLESRDKQLVVPRLARIYESTADRPEVREAIERNIEHLPEIYSALIKMDQFAFTFSMQAQMAADLVADPDFCASEEQMLAMKEGLGLRKPSEAFWLPVGQNTAQMTIQDKISLLAYIVPRFGSGNPEQEEALQAFVTGLKPTYAVIRSKCPDLSEPDIQLLGTELLASEVLTVGRSSRKEFALWLDSLSDQRIRQMLAARKSMADQAAEALTEYKQNKEAQVAARTEYKKIMDEQIATARNERSLYFNPRTRKLEVFKNPNAEKEKNKNPLQKLLSRD